MRCCLLLLILGTTLLNAQPPKSPPSAPAEVRLTIKVVDSSTGVGVPNASVDVLDAGDFDSGIDDVPRADFRGLSTVMVPRDASFVIHAGAPGYADRLSAVTTAKSDSLTVTVTL